MRLAFVGFRHGHIMGLYNQACTDAGVQVVGACEEDEPTAASLKAAGKVTLTHARFADLLGQVDCDAVAIGDTYGRRGDLVIAALGAGKHVISDKPICTRLVELEEIQRLAESRRLSVGCLLDLRAMSGPRTMRAAILSGAIGPVHTVGFTAQHPLMLGSRPGWYFEPGQHGGTINDIAVHALDLIPWMTGRQIVEVVAARAWNARLPQIPHFQDAAQVMLTLDNGGGVIGDVSYLAPDRCGYTAPQYWRITCHGSNGMIELASGGAVSIATHEDAAPRLLAPEPAMVGLCFESFRREIAGTSLADDLTTPQVLAASRHALQAQQAADRR